MPKPTPKKPLSWDEFFARFDEEIFGDLPDYEEGDPPTPSPKMLRAMLRRNRELRRALIAAEKNCPDACGFFLQAFLREYFPFEIPTGVFVNHIKARPGRKSDAETSRVWIRWLLIDRPSLYKATLAEAYCGDEYRLADEDEKKKIRDRLRRAVDRMEGRQKGPSVAKGSD